MKNKNSIYVLIDNLPIEIQRIIDSFWSWKNYYTDNIIYHLNYDLSINHFLKNVIDKRIVNNPYLLNKQKNEYHYHRSCLYFLNYKDYIFEINEKIKKVVNDKALLRFYRKKYNWMCIINTRYYDNAYIVDKIKYYSYMILYFNDLKKICIYHSLKNSFSNKEPIKIQELYSFQYLRQIHPNLKG